MSPPAKAVSRAGPRPLYNAVTATAITKNTNGAAVPRAGLSAHRTSAAAAVAAIALP